MPRTSGVVLVCVATVDAAVIAPVVTAVRENEPAALETAIMNLVGSCKAIGKPRTSVTPMVTPVLLCVPEATIVLTYFQALRVVTKVDPAVVLIDPVITSVIG